LQCFVVAALKVNVHSVPTSSPAEETLKPSPQQVQINKAVEEDTVSSVMQGPEPLQSSPCLTGPSLSDTKKTLIKPADIPAALVSQQSGEYSGTVDDPDGDGRDAVTRLAQYTPTSDVTNGQIDNGNTFDAGSGDIVGK